MAGRTYCLVFVSFSLLVCASSVLTLQGAGDILGGADISHACHRDLKKYALCKTVNELIAVCSSPDLLNSSKMQQVLGCANVSSDPSVRLKICHGVCLKEMELVVNQSLTGSCSSAYQSMHAFGAPLNVFSLDHVDSELNISKPILFLLPNIKGMKGPTLISFGQPDKCAQVSGAQYCILSGNLNMARAESTFALGNCLPETCSEEEIRSIVRQAGNASERLKIKVQCGLVQRVGKADGISEQLEDILGWGGIPVWYPRTIDITLGFSGMMAVIAFLVALVSAGTALELRRERKERLLQAGSVQLSVIPRLGEASVPLQQERLPFTHTTFFANFLNHWSLLRNVRSLLKTRDAQQNTFACLDAIRTLSMMQVILGHSYFYAMAATGYENMEQFNPPHGLLGQIWFQLIPGCFYGVDSFFVMSGFLCAHGLQLKVFSRPEMRTPKKFSLMYVQFLVVRYLRLVPLEMFVMVFDMVILPQMGSGILWNMDHPDGKHCHATAGASNCGTYWWANLLFLQNMDRFMAKCMIHTWYLANDFQLYLTAPFFALAYSFDKKLGWALLGVGLLAGVLIPIVLTAQNRWVPEIVAGAAGGFDSKFYMKPWCRCPAFFIGIALGWLWPEYLQQYAGRHTTRLGCLHSYAFSFLGLALCMIATFGRAFFFQCDITSCFNPDLSPVPRFLQYVWVGFSIPTWCIGLSIIMVLCFQNRFLPLLQDLLHFSCWQVIAKLSYAAYLIHTSVLILDYCQRDRPVFYSFSSFAFSFVAFVVSSLLAAALLWLFVEKPLANLQMKLLGGTSE